MRYALVLLALGCAGSHAATRATHVPSGSTVSVSVNVPPRLCDKDLGTTCWDHADHDFATALTSTLGKTLRIAEVGDYVATLKVAHFILAGGRPDQLGLSPGPASTTRFRASYTFKLADRSGKSIVEFTELAQGDEVSRPLVGVGLRSLLDAIMLRINESLKEVVDGSPGR